MPHAHAAAYALGYLLPRLAGLDRTTCRVCCIQVGAVHNQACSGKACIPHFHAR